MRSRPILADVPRCSSSNAIGRPSRRSLRPYDRARRSDAGVARVAGNIARELGDFAKARERYLAALDAGIDLDTWYVLGALAHTKRYADRDDPDIARFEAHARDEKYTPRARAATGFGLAKAYDDLGDYESAAHTLRDANARVRSVLPWSAAAWDAFVEARMNERVVHVRASTHSDFKPIFVVGLPRTGTTLTATRLAQHIGARDRGELRILRFIAERLITGGHLGDADAIAEAAALYRVHARQDDAPAPCYIDQDPMNFRYLHVIEAMFPDARVIWCRRNRRDTALSIWSQDFAHHDAAFAYDFASIAAVRGRSRSLVGLLACDAVVADSRARLRGARRKSVGGARCIERLHRCAATIRRSPSTETTPIHSASVWQARQPIYAASVGRWRKYAPFVPELTELFA
ncbi:MAG: sulfotransferase [Chitinophagaceae bacterium]